MSCDNFNPIMENSFMSQVSPSGSDKHFVHYQSVPATTWVVSHNLGKMPAIQCFDTTNRQIHGKVEQLSESMLKISYKFPYSGKAICN